MVSQLPFFGFLLSFSSSLRSASTISRIISSSFTSSTLPPSFFSNSPPSPSPPSVSYVFQLPTVSFTVVLVSPSPTALCYFLLFP